MIPLIAIKQILFNINNLFAYSEVVTSIAI